MCKETVLTQTRGQNAASSDMNSRCMAHNPMNRAISKSKRALPWRKKSVKKELVTDEVSTNVAQ